MANSRTLDKNSSGHQEDSIAVTAGIFISKFRRHIERDNCEHCRAILNE